LAREEAIMGEHHFGMGRGRIKAGMGHRIGEVVGRHGAALVWANVLGDGPSYWFARPNRGDVDNAQTERAVWAALEAEGLAGPDGLLPCCFRDG
jgi:hypothetical protein